MPDPNNYIVIPQYTYPVVDDAVMLAPMLAHTSPGTMHSISTETTGATVQLNWCGEFTTKKRRQKYAFLNPVKGEVNGYLCLCTR